MADLASLPVVQVRKPFWKKGGFWLSLAFVACFPYAWTHRVALEKKAKAARKSFSSRAVSAALGPAAEAALQAGEKLGAQAEQLKEYLPDGTEEEAGEGNTGRAPALALSAPDASPRRKSADAGLNPEDLIRKKSTGKSSGARLGAKGFRSVSAQTAGGRLNRERESVEKKPVALGEETRSHLYAPETSPEGELPWVETPLGKGILMFAGISACFALLGYVLLGLTSKHGKTFS
ncbi:MAG: hypothetical protein AAB576_07760 [Elusimicrobiota bacterium]